MLVCTVTQRQIPVYIVHLVIKATLIRILYNLIIIINAVMCKKGNFLRPLTIDFKKTNPTYEYECEVIKHNTVLLDD